MWQAIETAPKDGTWILVHGDIEDETYGNRTSITTAQYTNELGGSTTEWRWQFAWFDGGHYGVVKPTHWMPLPAPPAPYQHEHADGP